MPDHCHRGRSWYTRAFEIADGGAAKVMWYPPGQSGTAAGDLPGVAEISDAAAVIVMEEPRDYLRGLKFQRPCALGLALQHFA